MICRPKRCDGSTLVESCLVMILLCLILFGLLQVSILVAAHDVVAYAASAGARCAAIGYDNDMVEKTMHVAALPTMGPRAMGIAEEKQRVKAYLTQQSNGQLSHITAEYWNSLRATKADNGYVVEINLTQNYPLVFPFARAFYGDDRVALGSEAVQMESHADLYLY